MGSFARQRPASSTSFSALASTFKTCSRLSLFLDLHSSPPSGYRSSLRIPVIPPECLRRFFGAPYHSIRLTFERVVHRSQRCVHCLERRRVERRGPVDLSSWTTKRRFSASSSAFSPFPTSPSSFLRCFNSLPSPPSSSLPRPRSPLYPARCWVTFTSGRAERFFPGVTAGSTRSASRTTRARSSPPTVLLKVAWLLAAEATLTTTPRSQPAVRTPFTPLLQPNLRLTPPCFYAALFNNGRCIGSDKWWLDSMPVVEPENASDCLGSCTGDASLACATHWTALLYLLYGPSSFAPLPLLVLTLLLLTAVPNP